MRVASLLPGVHARRRTHPAPTADVTFRAAPDEQYRRWLQVHTPSPAELEAMRGHCATWDERPRVSILVPLYDTPTSLLRRMVESVFSQVYDRWQLCLADDHSTAPHIGEELQRLVTLDARVVAVARESNGGIAAATNTALGLADGEFVTFLDHDDVLHPHSLYRIVEALQNTPDADLLYSDEDKTLVDGTRGQVHFKQDFDPDLLLAGNYVSHLSVYRRELVQQAGGLRTGFDGSQDHDLALRISEHARRIVHVPDVLYSWSQVPGSAALGAHEKPYAWEAGRRAAEDAVQRRGIAATVTPGPFPGLCTVRHQAPDDATISLIVHGGDRETMLTAVDPETSARSEALGVAATNGLNAASALNRAARAAAGTVLVFVSGGLRPVPAVPWVLPLLEEAMRPEIGVATGRIIRADGHSEYEGYHTGADTVAESIGVLWPVAQRVAAASVDVMAIRRDMFLEHGGFDERYTASLYDVDLCLRLRRAGLAVMYTPLTVLRRVEGGTPSESPQDRAVFGERWQADDLHDPCVSPWIVRRDPFTIRLQ